MTAEVARAVSRALLVGLAFGCASAPDPAPQGLPEFEIPELERRAQLLLVGDRRLFDPFTIDQVLQGTASVRRQLALTLGQLGDPRGRDPLEELLVDEDPEVRRAAAYGLGHLGEAGSERSLLRSARDPDLGVGQAAVAALGQLEVPLREVVAALDGLPGLEQYRRLAPGLFRYQGEEILSLALQAVQVSDPGVYRWAVYALARKAVPEGAGVLSELLADPDPWLRGWAARGFGAVGEGAGVLDVLLPLLADDDPGVVVQALRAGLGIVASGRASAAPSWREPLSALIADPRPGVQLTAIEVASAWLPDPELTPRLVALAGAEVGDAGPVRRAREVALLSLAGAGVAEGTALVRAAAASDDSAERLLALEGARRLEDEEVIQVASNDRAAAIRSTAVSALLELKGEVGVAQRALTDPDPGVQIVALEWLARHPEIPIEEIAAADLRGQGLIDLGSALAEAIGARGREHPAEAGKARAMLERLLESDRFLTRRAAARELDELGGNSGPIGGVEGREGLAQYRDVLRRVWNPRRVRLETTAGVVDVELDGQTAPRTVLNFLQLVEQGYYDGLAFHRVIPDFVVQAGDNRGDGRGGPGYAVRDEHSLTPFGRGVLGMARSGPDTGGAQFFITLSEQPHLVGLYTAFGKVVSGDEVLDGIVQGDRVLTAREIR